MPSRCLIFSDIFFLPTTMFIHTFTFTFFIFHLFFMLQHFFETYKMATALDPYLDIAEGTFPVASAIDGWVRDPPAVSS